jgi:hypothetical protein
VRAKEFIVEYETRNLLYHGVPDGKTIGKILSSGYINPQEAFDLDQDVEQSRGEESPDRISLTRDQFLHFPYGGAVAQFVIDRDALKIYGYKIKPVVGAGVPNMYGSNKGETEEQVYKPIPIRAPFVVGFQYDPKLEIPKTVLKKFEKLGITPMPWKQPWKDDDVEYVPPIGKTKNKYDPDRLTVRGNSYMSGGVEYPANEWYIGYEPVTEPGAQYVFVQPSKNKKYLEDLLIKMKERMANQQTWDDLLPQDKYAKDWKQGRYRVKHGSPEYDKA